MHVCMINPVFTIEIINSKCYKEVKEVVIMTTKFKKLKVGEIEPSDDTIYDINNCDIDKKLFTPICPNKNCECELTDITRETQNGPSRYLMSPNHITGCPYSTAGSGVKTFNLSSESFVDTLSMLSDKKKKNNETIGIESGGNGAKNKKKKTDRYSEIEYINKPKPCRAMDDFVFSLYEMKDSDIINIKDTEGNSLEISKKDLIISKKNNANYDGKDLTGLKLIIDVRKQNEFKIPFVKGTYFMVLQTSLDGETTIDEDGNKEFHSDYQPVFIKFVFSSWDLMQEFKKSFNTRNEKAKKKGKTYKVPAIYCDLKPIEAEDVNGVKRTIYEAKVYDKSIAWIDKNSLELL